MNIDYLETLNLEVPFWYIISFFGRINVQCISSLVCTVYCQKQPSEQRCSVKQGALKDFVNLIVKKPVLESLFNKVAGLTHILKNFCQRLLLHSTCTVIVLLLICFTLYSAPSHHHCYYCYYLRCLFLVQIRKASKNLNLVSNFH